MISTPSHLKSCASATEIGEPESTTARRSSLTDGIWSVREGRRIGVPSGSGGSPMSR